MKKWLAWLGMGAGALIVISIIYVAVYDAGTITVRYAESPQAEVRMRASLLLASFLLAGTSLEVQRISDNVRVWVSGATDWQYGTLVGVDSARLHIRHPSSEVAYQVSELERIEVWRRKSVGVELLLGALAAIGGYALGDALNGETRPLTASREGDLALAGALGALYNGIRIAMYPGCWRRVRR
jgi:hypothetical protein